jgi:hypothetical protein
MAVLLTSAVASAATSAATSTAASSRAAGDHALAALPPVAGLTWHKLTLINGWAVADTVPSYAVRGGIVYLTGSMYQTVNGSYEFAVLPKVAWPSRTLYRTVYAGYRSTATLQIDTNGEMQVSSDPISNAQTNTSLAAISYPIADVTWHKLNLINGWQSAQSIYHTGDPAYAIKGGVVYISGSLEQPSGTRKEFAVLPRAARPARQVDLLVYAYGGRPAGLVIGSGGAMRISDAPQSNARVFSSLATIAYPVAGARWHKLTLINKWTPGPAALGYPAFTVIAGVVFLSGAVSNVSINNLTRFAVGPRQVLAAHWLDALVYTTGGHSGHIAVGTDEEAYTEKDGYFAALSGISYPQSS